MAESPTTITNKKGMEIGIYSFGDLTANPHTGKTISAQQRMEEMLAAAKMADEAGLDVFGLGEHHRLDYAVSSPTVALSAISQVTKQIKLTSATTVLNTNDPVRLFEEFATLDLLSKGRAEVIAGRGAFGESFPIFGYDVNLYDQLFEEHLDLFQKLNAKRQITWSGRYRTALQNADIAPRPIQKKIPIWVGVGGTPESAARAGRYGAGLAMGILGGDWLRFRALVDLYRQSAIQAGYPQKEIKVGVTGHAYIGKTTQQALNDYYPFHSTYWSTLNRQLGKPTTPTTRQEFDLLTSPEQALFVGSSQQVSEKILRQYERFGHQRFIAQVDIGGMPFKSVAKNIERLATEVAPVVRKATQ